METLRRAAAVVAATALMWTLLVGQQPAAADHLPYHDPSLPVATRVDDLLSRMSLDEKLGQMTQGERTEVSPGEVNQYRLGSVLSGGGSSPTPNTPQSWADMTDAYQDAALSTPLGIPLLYGADAVHGHSNVVGATIFPHNIGLGAAGDPELVREIGAATATEMAGTGVAWNFSPCLCVARNDRWGRTYESFGETPQLPSEMTTVIDGLQGPSLDAPDSVLATAKHYLGDGGTTGGVDQGDTQLSEAELREIHLPPFEAALERDVGSVMISFSSWNGDKLHGHQYLVTDVLKDELGFDGFVISDWNGIDQIDGQLGLSAADVRSAINAGIDMVMAPESWPEFIDLLRAEVQAGRVPASRIDDATERILTKKFELGLFEQPYADRDFLSTVGSAAHRDLAREAVSRSQVLLKNEGDVLPLPQDGSRIFVAGKNADDIGHQSGGWTIDWQGGSGPITPGTTILEGIRDTAAPSTTVTYDEDGDGIDGSYDVAVAVVGETPYAEGVGDLSAGMGLDSTDRATIDTLRAAGVPVVVVLVSGRPLDIADQLPQWDGLVAAWLPGTEGDGVADVLFGVVEPTGTLPVTWMQSAGQQPINEGDGQSPLFPYGFGLGYDSDPPDPDPTPTPTPTASPPAAGCHVDYRTNDWGSGFTAEVTVTNTGDTAVDGWTLAFTFPAGQQLTNGWSAVWSQEGTQVIAMNEAWNAGIPAGGSVTVGFTGSHNGSNPAPTSFTLNGTTCTTG